MTMLNLRDQAPASEAMHQTVASAPCSLVIFGGGGDLAQRKLFPAIYNLALDGAMPPEFVVAGFARKERDDANYREMARSAIERFSRRPLQPEVWETFQKRVFYQQGALDDPAAFQALKGRLEEAEARLGLPGNRVFYLSIPPSTFGTCVQHLQASGLVRPKGEPGPFARIIVEKPVGHDLESARAINATLSQVFEERQIFRIDHYLGKETVQNILVMRFGNAIFEPLWNQKYIDHVQITVAEEEGVGTRAGYYEEAGALRDMVQNHILQLLSLTAMEPPWTMNADVVRDQKLAVLNCLRPIDVSMVKQHVVRAQYDSGKTAKGEVPGYRMEEGVSPHSMTETFVGIKVFVDNWRWAGVPFYLRTGKRLAKRVSEIAVQFKDVPAILFNANPQMPLQPNVLALRLQPNEGMSFQISAKKPGPRVHIAPVYLDFDFGSTFGYQTPEAYERLLLDVMAGDPTLFMRWDAVEASWRWVTDILDAWKASGEKWLPQYKAGTWGPVEADRLIGADGREWRTP